MVYVKVTPELWIKKLRRDGFTDPTSAKKSLGRAAWSQNMKDRVTLLVDRYFAGHDLEEEDVQSVLSTPLTEQDRGLRPVKMRKEKVAPTVQAEPARKAAAKAVVTTADPYAEIRSIIQTALDALVAIKTVQEIDKGIPVPLEIDVLIDTVNVCVRKLGRTLPADLKAELAKLQKEYVEEGEEGEQDEEGKQFPKGLKVVTPTTPLSTPDPGVPLESNDVALDLWRKTKPSRVSGSGA